MYLHQETDILTNFIDAVANIKYLKTTSNMLIPAHCIATIPTKLTGISTTPCILEVEIEEIITIQIPQLVVINNSFKRRGRASSGTADSYKVVI